MMRRVILLSEAELRSLSKFLFMRYCLNAVWMVLAARRDTNGPPYFLSSISTYRQPFPVKTHFILETFPQTRAGTWFDILRMQRRLKQPLIGSFDSPTSGTFLVPGLVTALQLFVPSCPGGLWRAHSCQRELCSVCSLPLLACGAPGWLAGVGCAEPRRGLPGWGARWGSCPVVKRMESDN